MEAEAAGIPRQYPEPESAAWDAWTLQQRYRRIIGQVYEGRIISASRMDDLLDDLRSAEAGVEPERRGWLIPNVLAERSNLVVLGDDKATKSTEMHELAITVTTGTPHWGLAPFAWQGDPARVVLVQEENDTEVVFQDLEDISVARGLPPDTPTRLREGGHLRVISKPRLNLLNLTARAFICHLAESADYLFLDSLDKMGVPETNATGELSDTLGYLTQLQAELGTVIVLAWPFASRMRFDFDSALGGDILPRWWQGAIALSWNERTRTRRVQTCALRSRLGRHQFQLVGCGMGLWRLKESAEIESDAQKPDDAHLAKVRESLATDPDLSVRDRAEKIGLTKSKTHRLMAVIKGEA